MTPIEIPISYSHLTRNTTAIQALSHDTHHEGTPTGVSLPDGEAESHHRGDHWWVKRPPAVHIVPDTVEDQQTGIVSRVDYRADLNGQVDGGRSTNHRDVGVF